MSGSTPDPYALLGVPPTATAAEIARAYRRLLRDHHPDTSTGPSPAAGSDHPLVLDELRAAYALLHDPAARADYDRAAADRAAADRAAADRAAADRAAADRGRAPVAPPSRPGPDPRGTTHVTVVAPHVSVVAPHHDVPAQPDIRVGPVLWRPAR